MTNEEYMEIKKKYTVGSIEQFNFAMRQQAFDALDMQVEMYEINDDGEELIDVLTPEIIEQILDEFAYRMDNDWEYIFGRNMKNAIQAVTGLVC